jgi:hypothetical protein
LRARRRRAAAPSRQFAHDSAHCPLTQLLAWSNA